MILLNTEKCNKNFTFDFNLDLLECPYCNSDNLIKWGSYERNIYYIDNNTIIFDTIKIQRVKCKKCDHTHALIPKPIIPYKQYCLDVIIFCISNDKLTYNYNFSLDTINKWKYQFSKCLPYLKTMLNIHDSKTLISTIKSNIYSIYDNYIKVNKKILLMMHSGIFNT